MSDLGTGLLLLWFALVLGSVLGLWGRQYKKRRGDVVVTRTHLFVVKEPRYELVTGNCE